MTKEELTPEEKNLELWNSVCETDPEHTKAVAARGGWTAIDAMYQIRTATEKWGKYGDTWVVRSCVYSLIECDGKTTMVLDAMFCSPEGSFHISSDMKFVHDGDCRKKLLTDVTTKALSKLGFNADVFLGMYDDSKYVNELKKKKLVTDDQAEELKSLMGNNFASLGSKLKRAFGVTKLSDIRAKDFKEVKELIESNNTTEEGTE